jgi:hypothetical protein
MSTLEYIKCVSIMRLERMPIPASYNKNSSSCLNMEAVLLSFCIASILKLALNVNIGFNHLYLNSDSSK